MYIVSNQKEESLSIQCNIVNKVSLNLSFRNLSVLSMRSNHLFLHKYLFIYCQMNENPCSNQEIHMLFEYGFKLENT